MHHAVRGERRIPGKRLVDARAACPSASTSRSSGPCGKPSGGPRQRLVGLHVARLAGAAWRRRSRLGIRRLVAEAAGAIDRAEQDLQQVQDAAGVEAVGMGRDAAHGVHRRRGGRSSCRGARRSQSVQGMSSVDGFLEGRMGQLGGDAADRGGRDAGLALGDGSGA